MSRIVIADGQIIERACDMCFRTLPPAAHEDDVLCDSCYEAEPDFPSKVGNSDSSSLTAYRSVLLIGSFAQLAEGVDNEPKDIKSYSTELLTHCRRLSELPGRDAWLKSGLINLKRRNHRGVAVAALAVGDALANGEDPSEGIKALDREIRREFVWERAANREEELIRTRN